MWSAELNDKSYVFNFQNSDYDIRYCHNVYVCGWIFWYILIFYIDFNTTAASQRYTFLAQFLSFINIQELEIPAVLSYNHWKDQKQSSVVL